jgi:hypothetical protein
LREEKTKIGKMGMVLQSRDDQGKAASDPLRTSRFLASSSSTSSNFEGVGTVFLDINLHYVTGS